MGEYNELFLRLIEANVFSENELLIVTELLLNAEYSQYEFSVHDVSLIVVKLIELLNYIANNVTNILSIHGDVLTKVRKDYVSAFSYVVDDFIDVNETELNSMLIDVFHNASNLFETRIKALKAID